MCGNVKFKLKSCALPTKHTHKNGTARMPTNGVDGRSGSMIYGGTRKVGVEVLVEARMPGILHVCHGRGRKSKNNTAKSGGENKK